MKNVSNIEDKDLLEKFYSDKNNEWLGILLPRYTMLLFGVCMKYLKDQEDAKDAVQQIFLKVINELPKYKVEYFKSWIYIIAKNYCLMQLRNNVVSKVEVNEKMIDLQDDIENKEKLLQKEISLNELEMAMKELSDEQHQCLNLFYLEKRSYKEIMGLTGFSLLQVKSFIQNGKRNLKQALTRQGCIGNL